MKEYTVLSLLAVAARFVLDRLLGTGVTRKKAFWVFAGIMVFAETVVNGYLTSRPVFLYGERFISGLRVGTIPVEDFIFGFSFMTVVVILWEFFKKERGSHL